MLIYMIVALALLLSLFVYLFIKKQKEAKQYFLQTQEKEELLKKYSSIISIEDEIQKLEKDKSDEIFKIDTLRNDYKNKLEILNAILPSYITAYKIYLFIITTKHHKKKKIILYTCYLYENYVKIVILIGILQLFVEQYIHSGVCICITAVYV